MTELLNYLSYEFIQNAFLAGMIASISCGITGSLVVTNRLVFVSEGIAHSAFGGIGLALLLGYPPFTGAIIFCVLISLLIGVFTVNRLHRSDTIIGVVMSISMSLGIVFIDMTPGYKSEPMNYLFGSILTCSRSDIYFTLAFTLFLLVSISFFYRKILAVSYDPEYARSRGVNVSFFYLYIILMTALTVVFLIKLVGLILFVALLTIPPFIVEKYSSSLKWMMINSAILTLIITQTGMAVSVVYNLTSGATIALTAGIIFFLDALIIRRLILR